MSDSTSRGTPRRGTNPSSRATSARIRPKPKAVKSDDIEVVDYEIPIKGTINVYDFQAMKFFRSDSGIASVQSVEAIKKAIVCELSINLDLCVQTIDFSKHYESSVIANILSARANTNIQVSKLVPYYFSTGTKSTERLITSDQSYKQSIEFFVQIYESDDQITDSESMNVEGSVGVEKGVVKAGITLGGTFSKGRIYSMPGAVIVGKIKLELNTIGIGTTQQISSLKLIEASFSPGSLKFRQNHFFKSESDIEGGLAPFIPVEPRFSRGKDNRESKASLNDLLINGDMLSINHKSPTLQIIMSKSSRLFRQ